MAKEISRQRKKLIVALIMTIGSIVATVVGIKNPEAGKVINTIVEQIGSGISDIVSPADTLTTDF